MYRKLAAKELADLLGLISHPARIRIIEELVLEELDVTNLSSKLELTQSATSRHLSLLKAHNIVVMRKAGRNIYYHLSVPELASWLIRGLDIVEQKQIQNKSSNKAIREAKKIWSCNSRVVAG
jgi:DNA-binding transcriptional ArsR family regulator